jgi:aspartate aminotransferase
VELLERRGLALVPGGAFGGEGHVRWSFAASEEEIDEGIDRFRKAVLGSD